MLMGTILRMQVKTRCLDNEIFFPFEFCCVVFNDLTYYLTAIESI